MKATLTTGLLTILLSTSFGQNFQSTFQQFNGAFVPDRLHIHFDKTSYAPGDTIWFKAYLIRGILPAEESKTLYIDWTDESGKLINRTLSPIAAGVTYGQIALPVDYQSNYIHAKAYTKWMLNFDTAFLYNKDLRVVSAGNITEKNEKVRTTLTLFPESGNLVDGITSKVAFKATDQYGRPVGVAGRLVTDGKAGSETKAMHDGMGYFFIQPQKGKSYSFSWTDPSGAAQHTKLPDIKEKGLVLQVTARGTDKIFSVQTNDAAVTTVHIIGTMYRQSVFNITRTPDSGKVQGLIPTGSLPDGVLTITVLDQNYHPLAERITFVNNEEYRFRTEMRVEHWGLNKRARNEIEISVPDSVSANLSISVTDNDIDFDTTHSIISDLLLSSELKGTIHDPVFYFTADPDTAMPLLDLVMLTNGWRKIWWDDLAKGKLPEILFPADTSYQTISGKVYGATPAQLVNAGDMVLVVNQKDQNEWMTAHVNGDGTFKVNDFMLFDTATVYYQPPKGRQLKNVSVQFLQDRLPTQPLSVAGKESYLSNKDTSGLARHNLLSEALQSELKFFKGKVLEGVTITAKTKAPEDILDEQYTSGLFSGGNARNFDLRDDPASAAYQNIFQYLQGRVAGVSVTMSNPPSVTWRGGSPALFLNEMPVDAEMLSTVPVTDIAYVKVLSPPFMGAPGGGGNGAIAIYTRKGGDIQSEPGKGLSKNTLTGYSVIRQFYAPDYDRTMEDRKDLRTTLYWNPEVILNPGNNKVILKFFNNDVTDAFRVVIEGMSQDGKLTRLIKVME